MSKFLRYTVKLNIIYSPGEVLSFFGVSPVNYSDSDNDVSYRFNGENNV